MGGSRLVVQAARASGAQHLVVSAIGSGAFSNPPQVVAAALVRALAVSAPGSALRRVTACVLDDHNSRDNVERFRAVMLEAGAHEGVTLPNPRVALALAPEEDVDAAGSTGASTDSPAMDTARRAQNDPTTGGGGV
jgi:hypothetical protein